MTGKQKYIVLDIDATLVHTHGDMDDFKMLKIYGSDEQLEMRRKLYKELQVKCSPAQEKCKAYLRFEGLPGRRFGGHSFFCFLFLL